MGGEGMEESADIHKNILHRLKIARGHLNSVIAMVEKRKYCIDVIHQSKAIQKSLKEVDFLLLQSHLSCCVVDLIKDGKTQQSIEEIMGIFKRQ